MKVEKDGVVKEVDNALVPDYVTAGWKKAENKSNKNNYKNNNDREELDAKLRG